MALRNRRHRPIQSEILGASMEGRSSEGALDGLAALLKFEPTQLPIAGCYLPHWPAPGASGGLSGAGLGPGAAGGGDTSGAWGLGSGADGLGSAFVGDVDDIGLLRSSELES
jgi:hypothetical protein